MPSVSDEEHTGQLKRLASVSLPSLACQSGNIDISHQGSIALLTTETIYIFTPALNISPLLKPDVTLTCHHDPSQKIPFFRSLIPLKACPPDISKAGKGLDAYMIAYEQRFKDAKWSLSGSGLSLSPMLAVLTTQSQIFLYTARTNAFKGPWSQLACLTGGERRHIMAMVWVEGSPTHSWLLAGTSQGEVIKWEVGPERVEEHSSISLAEGEIHSLVCSPLGFLFMSTTKGIQIAQAHQTSEGFTFQPSTHQPPSLSGAQVSIARWNGNSILYCTPGQVHHFEAKTGVYQSVLLESSDDDESCSFRPAVAIRHLQSGAWEVYLNDGTLYHISQRTLGTDFVRPTSYLPPPNEVIGSLQRHVEAAQGLFAKSDDSTGLTYICHDDNDTASWSYFRDPKCQFGVALTQTPRMSQELPMAGQLLEAASKGDARHLRTFVAFYKYTASNKAKVWTMALQALQTEVESKQHLQAALRLSVWMHNEDAKDASITSLYQECLEQSLAEALSKRIEFMLPDVTSALNADDAHHCTRLAKAGYSLSVRVGHTDLKQICQQLMLSIDKRADLALLTEGASFDLGETCKACGSSVSFQTDNVLYAKCQNGHVWKRCATSLELLTTSANRCCSICSSETIQPTEAKSTLQRRLIESITLCDLCNGVFFL